MGIHPRFGEKKKKEDISFRIEEGKGVLDGQVIFLSYHVDLRRHGIGGDESVADSRGRRGPPLGNGMGFQHVQGDHC